MYVKVWAVAYDGDNPIWEKRSRRGTSEYISASLGGVSPLPRITLHLRAEEGNRINDLNE